MIKIQRIYNDESTQETFRILVDRLWPRGVSKEDANLDEWVKEIAPSNKIRKEFNHEADKYKIFKDNYRAELNSNDKAEEFIEMVKHQLKEKDVILLYGAKNKKMNNAVVLREWLKDKLN